MKKILIGLAVIGITTLQVNAFEWSSLLNFIGKASETQTSQLQTTTLNDLERQMTTIDSSVQTAFVDIVSELSGWKETRSVKSQLKSNEIALADVISNYANTYIANNKQKIVNKIQKMSAKEKTALVNDIKTLAEGGQNYLLLAANGAKTASTALKSAQTVSEVTTTITNINKTASELKQRATTVTTFINQIKSMATAAGVSLNI